MQHQTVPQSPAEDRLATTLAAYRLRDAIVQMTIRYGSSMQRAAYAHKRTPGGEEWQRHQRAAQRQFWAIQRLADRIPAAALGGAL